MTHSFPTRPSADRAGRNAGPHNPQCYLLGSYEHLNGVRVAVKLKVENGTEGYDDKNRVAEYLTPNPASPGNNGWVLLSAGQYNTNQIGRASCRERVCQYV